MIKVTKVLTETFCEFQEGKKKDTGSIERFVGHAAPFFLYDPSTETYSCPNPPPELTPVYITNLLKKTCETWLAAELGRAAYDNMMASPVRVIPVTVTSLADIDRAFHPAIRKALFILFGDLFKPLTFSCDTIEEVLRIMKENPFPMNKRLTLAGGKPHAPPVSILNHRMEVYEPGKVYDGYKLIVLDKGVWGARPLLPLLRCKILIQTNFFISKGEKKRDETQIE